MKKGDKQIIKMNVQECRGIGKPTKRSNVRRAIRERNIK